ncbi:DEKNAAC104198 [Brettanomyces naardenensis]|uniref:DEKNAAC104198 n=1 Tax=Brettanomyces naardenensis TaxID=13370 RepID=A0A448YQ28_BRENA|nr:DEKNAAC104198 [Brettanomyces naardenensis]
MAPPNFSEIAKPTNDVLSKDFYHSTPVAFDVKTVAPNGVTFTTKGSVNPEKKTSASLEAKYSDKAAGLSLTQGWTTANALNTKIELADALTPGLKAELVTSLVPGASRASKFNLYFAQQAVNARAFVDLLKGPVFSGDFTVGQDGFTAGGALSYDVKAAALTGYSAGIGYKAPSYSLSLIAANSLSVFSAGYYHKVSPVIEVGAKGTFDSNGTAGPNAVSIEVGTKYTLDDSAFVKAKIADSGVLALGYHQLLRPGITLGLGGAFDTLKLSESAHKLGLSLSFSA